MATRIATRVVDAVAWVELDGADRLNVIGSQTYIDLAEALRTSESQRSVRAVVIHGAGRAFCAGADIEEIKAFGSRDDFADFIHGFTDALDVLVASPLPVIAAIHGSALGGGLELAMACDLRVATPEARLGLPEAKLGVLPGGGGTQRLPRLVGPGIAKELIFSGRRIDAEEARMLNLVNRVVPEGEALNEARELAGQIAKNGPVAVRHAKAAANKSLDVDLTSGLEFEADQFALLFATEDAREGMGAFVEKREAEFKGR